MTLDCDTYSLYHLVIPHNLPGEKEEAKPVRTGGVRLREELAWGLHISEELP